MRLPGARAATIAGSVVLMSGLALVALGGTQQANRTLTPTAAQIQSPDAHNGRHDGERQLTALQDRLRRLPNDYTAWASLGLAYVQQARITADPSFYPKADGALSRSLVIQPRDNYLALLGQGATAAARHDFPGALALAERAAAIDPQASSVYGVMGDALIELGRYDEAFRAIQHMLDLSPDTGSLARGSYTWELRGNIPLARMNLERARDEAGSRSDMAFADYYLGELAFNSGDLAGARSHYLAGQRADATYLPLRAGLAKVLAAEGRTAAALAAYKAVTDELPQPGYLIEYGDLLASTGDTDAARRQYELVRVEEQLFQSQGVNTDLELALFDADHGRASQALRTAQAERARRDSIAVDDALAWALHANGRDREALAAARRAARLGFRSASFAYHRGMIEASLGERAAAVRDLRLALAINPHFSLLQAPIARARLAELTS
ncbi:MAG: hypothetical protein QOJ92_1536 [Frankiales bacterium]|nr:hypothetical protein [Frankiales bacterium]